MLDRIFVPTFRRLKQHTYNNFPKRWQAITALVVDESDQDRLAAKGYSTILCPVQGKGLAPVKKWIMEYARDAGLKKFGILDDDLYNFCYTRLATEKDKYPLWNTKFTDKNWDEAFNLMDEWLDEVVTCSLEICWNPPLEKMYHTNFRQSGNHFYNVERFPYDEIDWLSVPFAEDFYVTLQLLTKGYENRVSLRYRIRPMPTQHSEGGCSAMRSIENHNESMRELHRRFPEFVKIYEKVTASKGASKWDGVTKLAAEVAWKRAYASSQKEPQKTLEEFFA